MDTADTINSVMDFIRQLERVLAKLADCDHYLFAATDLQGALPGHGGLPVLLSRAAKAGLLQRVCRGLYLYPRIEHPRGLLLFHAAARLRADEFDYISLESATASSGGS